MVDNDTLIHLVAGGVGGTAGAIFTCPLEVVKTRLQSSNSGFDPSLTAVQKNQTTTKSTPNAAQAKKTVWSGISKVRWYRPALGSQYSISLLNGGSRSLGSTTPILYSTQSQPCRPLKTKLNSFPDRATKHVHTGSVMGVHTASAGPLEPPTPRPTGLTVWGCLKHIWVHEGPRGLFRGIGANLVGVAPSRAIYFWSYSTAKQRLNKSLPPPNRDTPFVHVLSAASAGFISSCVTNPIWLVKTRLQLDRSNGGLLSVIKSIHTEKGMAGFWKGVTASWWGISETIIHFVIYEYLKKCLAERQELRRTTEKTTIDFVGFMLCGAVSKTCATCVAYPHEVARTRMRESGSKYRTFWQTLRVVGREEGRRGLYRGLATQLVRQIPNTAIMMATYEATVYMLTKYLKEKRAKNVQLEAISSKSSHSQ